MAAGERAEQEIRLICGLGNPGPEYARTRHNCGFMLLDKLAELYGARWQRTKFKGELCRAVIGGERVLLFKPMTYMNNSGEALRAIADYYRLKPEELLVAYDDVDLPLGSLRLREKGSPGSHNGMRSVVKHLNSQNFPRLRIGIGPEPREMDIADYVLSAYHGAEQELLEETLEMAAEAVVFAVRRGLQKSMSRYNGKSKQKKEEEPKPAASDEAGAQDTALKGHAHADE